MPSELNAIYISELNCPGKQAFILVDKTKLKKGIVAPVQAVMACRWNSGIAPLILDVDRRWM